MCIFYLVTFVNYMTLKAKTHVGSILSIHAMFFIYYYFSIFVQIQNQLWQGNTETLKIMRQNNFFYVRKRSKSPCCSGGTSAVWGISASCVHLSWSSRSRCSLSSQSQAYRKRRSDRMSLQDPLTANHLHLISDGQRDRVIFIHIGTFQMNQKGCFIGWSRV